MPRVDRSPQVRWRTEYVAPPPAQRLLTPDVPRDADSTAPTSTGRVIGPGLLDVPFTALADKAQRTFDADNSTLDAVSLELIVAAEKRLDAEGVKYSHTKTTDGYYALQIEPNETGHLLADPAYDLAEKLGGFRFLYSPGKLLARHSNGDHWRYTRELCLAHQSIQDMLLDPVTVHEMEHTVLSRAEEKGIPQVFTGSIQSNPGGAIPTDSGGVGGYVHYLSIQEVSAYSEQCFVHANRIRAVDFEPNYADEAAMLKEMSVWGVALTERIAEVASKIQSALADRPPIHAKLSDTNTIVDGDGAPLDTSHDQLGVHVRVERFQMKIKPFGADEEQPAGGPTVWVQTRGLPFSASVPLPQAAADVDANDFVAVRDKLSDHYARLESACLALKPEFEAVREEAARLENIRPLERHQLDTLVDRVLGLRDATKRITLEYRNTFDRG